VIDWFQSHPAVTGWLFGVSVAMFLAGLIVTPLVIARLPADYFIRPKVPEGSWRNRHPVIRVTLRTVKNLLGAVLVVAGIAMLVLPGQGLVTIVVGVSLFDFPGKRRLAVRILRQRPVFQTINWVRSKAKQPPLVLPPPSEV
jgi:hypothetical protein